MHEFCYSLSRLITDSIDAGKRYALVFFDSLMSKYVSCHLFLCFGLLNLYVFVLSIVHEDVIVVRVTGSSKSGTMNSELPQEMSQNKFRNSPNHVAKRMIGVRHAA